MFPSKWLKADDLQNRTITVTVDGIELEEVEQGKPKRPVLYFVGKDKGLVLNKTNASMIAAFHGDDTDGWRGKELKLRSEKVSFRGDIVDAIRVHVDQQPPPAGEDDDPPF